MAERLRELEQEGRLRVALAVLATARRDLSSAPLAAH